MKLPRRCGQVLLVVIVCGVIVCGLTALAADKEHGTLVCDAALYVTPGSTSEKIGRVERGRDLIVLERIELAATAAEQTSVAEKAPWFKVFVTLPQGTAVREMTGWLPALGVVTFSTPNGDRIIYGEAVDSENQAEQRGGRKGAAEDAMRLYYRVGDLFPSSPLAAEATWRSADIRWQLEKNQIMSRPSQRDLSPDARDHVDEQWMKETIKRYPHTRWADLAAYDMIDNRLCGEWKGLAACPEKESDIYERYAREHAQSPKAAEALYYAAWRQAVLADIYRINSDGTRSALARKKARALAQEIAIMPTDGDWQPRAAVLIFKLERNIPLYGPGPE